MEDHPEIVAIGASAGGIDALIKVVRRLPADLPAAVLVVVHVPATSTSNLPAILSRSGPLPAKHAQHREPIAPGQIYVAPPDMHLLVRSGYLELERGPRENHNRPAIDPLFRTAARAYGSRVIGIILSGALSDGTAGFLAIKARNGSVVVQDPDDAIIRSMPDSALRLVDVDHVLPADEIGPLLDAMMKSPAPPEGTTVVDAEQRMAQVISSDLVQLSRDQKRAELTIYSCPDCGGSMWQADGNPFNHFQCHVGHSFGQEMLLELKSEELERALWSSVRLMTEKATLMRHLSARNTRGDGSGLAARFEEQAVLAERNAHVLKDLLGALPSNIAQSPASD